MFDRVLNMPLDYFSCLTLVLGGMHGKFDKCQTDYSIHSNLRNFPYSEVVNGSTTFKLMEDQQTLKKNDQLVKLVSAIFDQIFIFSPNDKPLKTMKNVFCFIEKALFASSKKLYLILYQLTKFQCHTFFLSQGTNKKCY